MQFESSTTINASAQTVFELYTDVNNWKSWDPDVKSSSLAGAFTSGSVGEVVPHGGPKSKVHLWRW